MKELQYFKFFYLKWLAGSIQLFSDAEKGTFIDLCAHTMEEGGKLNFNNPMLARKLRIDNATLCERIRAYAEADLVVCEGDFLSIKFIDDQIEAYHKTCQKNRENANKRWGNKSEGMPIREEKKRLEYNRKENINIPGFLNTPEIRKALIDWLDMMDLKGIIFTDTQMDLHFRDLLTMQTPENALESIEKSTKKGYKEFYDPRTSKDSETYVESETKQQLKELKEQGRI